MRSTRRRDLGKNREQNRGLVPPFQCPVEGCLIGAAYPGIRPQCHTACSVAGKLLTPRWPITLSVNGTNPFRRVLTTPTPTSPFSVHLTLEMTLDRPPRNRCKSLFTTVTVDPAHFRSLPQKGGPGRPPICGMVSRLAVPHTRRQKVRQRQPEVGSREARRIKQ